MTIELVPIAQIPFPAFVRVFNQAYQGYFIPIFMEVDAMQRLVKRDQIDLQASLVALENDQPIGVGMLAVNGPKAWIGGLGVIASHRGLGIGRRITTQLIANARALGVAEIYLEVIESNTPARRIYQDLNFETIRQLLVVEAPPQSFELMSGDYVVAQAPVLEALRYYEAFHALPNSWQRRLESLTFLADSLDAWVIRREDGVLAYALAWVWDDIIRWMDIGMAEGAEEAEEGLSILLQTIHNLAPAAVASLSNLPADESIWQVMQMLNYRATLTQHEMRLILG